MTVKTAERRTKMDHGPGWEVVGLFSLGSREFESTITGRVTASSRFISSAYRTLKSDSVDSPSNRLFCPPATRIGLVIVCGSEISWNIYNDPKLCVQAR